MKPSIKHIYILIAAVSTLLAIMACSLFGGIDGGSDSQATPTPTVIIPVNPGEEQPSNPCEGVSGTLEMQILVGPSEVVGLEPVAVGDIPFTVSQVEDGYPVQGGGSITYQDVLQEEWGTYTVSFDMDVDIEGECIPQNDGGALALTLIATGEQLVEVRAEGFSGDYPWSGTHHLDLAFPLEDGAQAEGEGWAFILILDK